MINIIETRHSWKSLDEVPVYMVKCPCCKCILSFGKDDVYKQEDDSYVHHEYIDCPSCNEEIQLPDEDNYGY